MLIVIAAVVVYAAVMAVVLGMCATSALGDGKLAGATPDLQVTESPSDSFEPAPLQAQLSPLRRAGA